MAKDINKRIKRFGSALDRHTKAWASSGATNKGAAHARATADSNATSLLRGVGLDAATKELNSLNKVYGFGAKKKRK